MMRDAQATLAGPDHLRLSRRGIVAFADVDWDGVWYSRHQILRRLSALCPVVIVASPVEARELLAGRAPAQVALQDVAPQLWSYHPPRWLPLLYRPKAIASMAATLRGRHLDSTVRRLGLVDPIHYVWHPDYAATLARLPRRFTIYHRYDKFDAYEGASAARVQTLESEVAARANLLIASSRVMASDLENLAGKSVMHLQHGVDFEFFHDRAERNPIPDDMAQLPRPRVGFVGRLNEGLDDSALTEIATQRPDWSVVLVGPETYQSSEERRKFLELTSRPNVHALGPRPRDAVPAYIAGLDVGLLCYRMGNWVMWGQPIKAYEYLACGRPIVSSPINAVTDFGDLVRVARVPGGWVSAIEEALRHDTPEETVRRESFARKNTWDERVSELVRAIEGTLAQEGASDRRTAEKPDSDGPQERS